MLDSSQLIQKIRFQTAFDARRNIIVHEEDGLFPARESLFPKRQRMFSQGEGLFPEQQDLFRRGEGFMAERSNVGVGRNDMCS